MRWRRYFTLVLLITVVLIWSLALRIERPYLKIVFCDVGQGDAILITYGYTDLLIDGGPDARVLNCLERHLQLGDKTIEAIILTHPQADHMAGLLWVLDKYKVDKFIGGIERNDTVGYRKLLERLHATRTNFYPVYAGDRLAVRGAGQLNGLFVWPQKEWMTSHVLGDSNGEVLGAETDGTDLNSFSVGLLLSYGRFKALFTGDSDIKVESAIINTGLLEKLDVLKIPHHGSKTGISVDMMEIVNPSVGVISVGKTNKYGHPASEILQMLSDYGVGIYRTDLSGDVVLEVKGSTAWLRTGTGATVRVK